MKTWNIPTAVAQRFAANDYVSACGYEVLCDFEIPEGLSYLQAQNFDWNQDGTVDFPGNFYCSPCGKKHIVGKDTEFLSYTFKKGSPNPNTTGLVALDTPITTYFWPEFDGNGNIVDMHFTDPKNVQNMVEANKS